MVHRRLGAVARVSWGVPPIWSEAQVPFPLEFIPPALSPRLPDCGSSNLRRNALSGLQNGRRGPSRRLSGAFPAPFRGKSDRDCRKTRGNRRSDALLRSRTGEGVLPNAQNQVDVDPAVAPPCAHRGRSHEARRPWPMRAGWPYIDQQPKLPNGPCSSSRLMVVVSRGIPIPLPRRWKTDSASSFQQTMRTGQPSPRSAEP